MSTKYQVFVSSTYDDLKEERDRVIQGILEMGNIPVGMEMFSAADEEQWKIIARHIDESDYYVVILAHRYGSIAGNVSYTRKEYEYAKSRGIPIVGFVIDQSAAWPGDRVDTEPADVERLKDFKSLVEQKPVGYWTNADDLYGKSTLALMKTQNSQPRTGWVRATSAMGPEVTAELSRLSAENAELRKALADATEQGEREMDALLDATWARLAEAEWDHVGRFPSSYEWLEAEPLKLAFLFSIMAPVMVVEAGSATLNNLVSINSDRKGAEGEKASTVPTNQLSGLLSTFMSLDLMEPSTKRHAVADQEEYWSLTDKGRALLRRRQVRQFESKLTTDDGDTTQVQSG